MSESTKLSLSSDAAIVLALAETAIPFAASERDEAERWVRVLRLHGQVGATLQALGVGEAPLESPAESAAVRGPRSSQRRGVVKSVTRRASHFARGRSADRISTIDILFAVFELYGSTFDRALYIRGTTRDELLERLACAASATPSA